MFVLSDIHYDLRVVIAKIRNKIIMTTNKIENSEASNSEAIFIEKLLQGIARLLHSFTINQFTRSSTVHSRKFS